MQVINGDNGSSRSIDSMSLNVHFRAQEEGMMLKLHYAVNKIIK